MKRQMFDHNVMRLKRLGALERTLNGIRKFSPPYKHPTTGGLHPSQQTISRQAFQDRELARKVLAEVKHDGLVPYDYALAAYQRGLNTG